MSRGELKPPGQYWFVRIYTAAVLLVWDSLILVHLYNGLTVGKEPDFLAVGAMTPLAFLAILAMFSWGAFPFAYSRLGRYKRTAFPKEAAIHRIDGSWIVISSCFRSNLDVSWLVFPSGLGISIGGIGRVFLPSTEIDEITRGGRSYYRMSHTCPEVRSPITIPAKVIETIRNFELIRTPEWARLFPPG